MKKEKFFYNQHTLQYEKIRETWGSRLVRAFGFLCAALLTGVLMTIIFSHFNATPREQALISEIEALQSQLAEADQDFSSMSEVLNHLQVRDAHAFRTVFGMEQIDSSIWMGGIGGHDKYEHLRDYKNSGEQMAGLRGRIDQIKHQLKLQSESLDEISAAAREKESVLAAMPSIKPVRVDKLARGIRQLSGFGRRIHPIYKVPKMHYGIDFTAPRGTKIQATGAGTIKRVEFKKSGYGKNVLIDHGNGHETLYGHMSKIYVKVGESVKRGQAIGEVGNTGASTAPHCHYEVHVHGKKVNPLHYCLDNLTKEEYQALVNAAETTNQFFDY